MSDGVDPNGGLTYSSADIAAMDVVERIARHERSNRNDTQPSDGPGLAAALFAADAFANTIVRSEGNISPAAVEMAKGWQKARGQS